MRNSMRTFLGGRVVVGVALLAGPACSTNAPSPSSMIDAGNLVLDAGATDADTTPSYASTCAAIVMVAATCPTTIPTPWANETECEAALARGATSGCGIEALTRFVARQEITPAYSCSDHFDGETTTTVVEPHPNRSPTEAVLYADNCAQVLSRPACFGEPCGAEVRCAEGLACNSQTMHCMTPGSDLCAGMPCASNADCSSSSAICYEGFCL